MKLKIVSPKNSIVVDLYEGQSVVLGRTGGNNNISLEDQYVSSRHLQLTAVGNVLEVVDLGSTNGSYIDYEQMKIGKVYYIMKNQKINIGNLNNVLEVIEINESAVNFIDVIRNTETFYGGHVSSFKEFKNLTIKYFGVDGWVHSTQCLNIFLIPRHILEKIEIVGIYRTSHLYLDPTEVIIAAYINPRAINYSDPSDKKVDANLLFMKIGNLTFQFSLSVWIDEYREIPCISNMEIDLMTDELIIDSYIQFSKNNVIDNNFRIQIPENSLSCEIIELWNDISDNFSTGLF